ncbi:hypothetical protein RINTHH_19940 [Richelia intracellularis HH01]|uniref:Uncharacterized protein n=1 Tax=Richelia intracellularis HH01 TaxID=1165094 RepID=M1WTJ1_9NOST|nr:hypothetical protein RINTHH_19940 [Richelia intracellularis HH01]
MLNDILGRLLMNNCRCSFYSSKAEINLVFLMKEMETGDN